MLFLLFRSCLDVLGRNELALSVCIGLALLVRNGLVMMEVVMLRLSEVVGSV